MAPRSEHLHAQANPQQRLAIRVNGTAQSVDPPGFPQGSHAVAESTYSRQDYPICLLESGRTIHDICIGPEIPKSAAHRRQIAHAIVDDRHPHGLS